MLAANADEYSHFPNLKAIHCQEGRESRVHHRHFFI